MNPEQIPNLNPQAQSKLEDIENNLTHMRGVLENTPLEPETAKNVQEEIERYEQMREDLLSSE